MKTLEFTTSTFLASFAEADKIPPFKNKEGKLLLEIALVGRSNVGKSSLINSITKKKGLAKTSSTPGKTRLINFFSIDDQFLLVDLPGYGFAKIEKEQQKHWAKHLDHYLRHRKTLKALLILLDIRRVLSEEDVAMIAFANAQKVKCVFVFTKTDKLKKAEIQASLEKNIEIAQTVYSGPIESVLFSIKDSASCHALIKKIATLV